jgi:hypothetical protein
MERVTETERISEEMIMKKERVIEEGVHMLWRRCGLWRRTGLRRSFHGNLFLKKSSNLHKSLSYIKCNAYQSMVGL